MNEEDFAAFNEHLEEVRPIFDAFCARSRFTYVDRRALGRYPRIRVERPGKVSIWFDLWMEVDKEGRRFEQFRRDLPYELSSGAYMIEQDGSPHGVRLQISFSCFSGKPFEEVAAVLSAELDRNLLDLERWDEQYLKENGKRIQLR